MAISSRARIGLIDGDVGLDVIMPAEQCHGVRIVIALWKIVLVIGFLVPDS